MHDRYEQILQFGGLTARWQCPYACSTGTAGAGPVDSRQLWLSEPTDQSGPDYTEPAAQYGGTGPKTLCGDPHMR